MKKVSVFPFVSLIISIFAFVMYVALLDGFSLFWLWVVSSIVALLFPFLSKYLRKKAGKAGKAVEITALIIGVFDTYFVFFFTTKIDLLLVIAAIIGVCIVYANMFNDVVPQVFEEPPIEKTEEKSVIDEQEEHIERTENEGVATKEAIVCNRSRNEKKRYCKECGNLVDLETKRCTSCAKQYFKWKGSTTAIVVLLIICLLLAGVIVFQNTEMFNGDRSATSKATQTTTTTRRTTTTTRRIVNKDDTYIEFDRDSFNRDRYSEMTINELFDNPSNHKDEFVKIAGYVSFYYKSHFVDMNNAFKIYLTETPSEFVNQSLSGKQGSFEQIMMMGTLCHQRYEPHIIAHIYEKKTENYFDGEPIGLSNDCTGKWIEMFGRFVYDKDDQEYYLYVYAYEMSDV